MGREGMFIKFCGITRSEDAQQAARLGASAVGFIFAPSPRRVERRQASDMSARLHPSVRKIGVFVDASMDEIAETAAGCGLDGVQLQGSEDDGFISSLRARLGDIFIIKAVRPVTDAPFEIDFPSADAVLIDPKDPKDPHRTSQPLRAETLEGFDLSNIVLAGGLTPANVAETITRLRPWGVDVSSGVEEAPGIKDLGLMKSFVHEVRKAEGMARHPSVR